MTDRNTLPARRQCDTFEVLHKELHYTVSVGYFPPVQGNGIAEVFITGTKAGSDQEAIARDGAVTLSIALQYGVPLATLASAITRGGNGDPSSIVGAVIDLLAKEVEGAN